MIAEAKNNIIVESIVTKKRMPAYSSSKISALEDIAIFTETGEAPLKDIFKSISELENGGPAINPKSSGNKLKEYFKKILPDYDQDRVYVSDMKKVFTWYNLLLENELLNFDEEEEVPAEEVNEETKPEEPAKEG